MNKREKEVIQLQLEAEEDILAELEKQYKRALKDIEDKIKFLQTDELTQSRIYQIQYQQALKGQIEGIIEKLHSDSYTSIQQFLKSAYTDAFIGTAYDLAGQGIPLLMPIDQNAAVKAIINDSKIKEDLYTSLGVDAKALKKSIRQEITRGIASGMHYQDIARNIKEASNAPLSRAKTIARTESHRIQQASTYDAQKAAKARGADVVKQWDSTLDGRTRSTHRHLDGQIKEVEEPFEMDGKKAMFPGEFGDPAEDCNCRCVSLTRARWALDDDELKTLQDRAEFFGLDKTKDFNEFKGNYLKAVEETSKNEGFVPAKTKEEATQRAKNLGVEYVEYGKLPLEMANTINEALATLPDDVKPIFVGDSATLEKYWGGKLPRTSKHYFGVTIDTFDGIHLGLNSEGTKFVVDYDAAGYMVGISSSYKTSDKITAAKEAANAAYKAKHNGHTWYFNVTGETTAAHEMGHVYINTRGIPEGFSEAAKRWAEETKCDMLLKESEAWAEAWAAHHTGANTIPDYIAAFIKGAK